MSNENVIAKAGMSTTREALERYEVLKAMNLLAKVTNNEEFYYNHWIYIVPDEADDEELLDIAEDDQRCCSLLPGPLGRVRTRRRIVYWQDRLPRT